MSFTFFPYSSIFFPPGVNPPAYLFPGVQANQIPPPSATPKTTPPYVVDWGNDNPPSPSDHSLLVGRRVAINVGGIASTEYENYHFFVQGDSNLNGSTTTVGLQVNGDATVTGKTTLQGQNLPLALQVNGNAAVKSADPASAGFTPPTLLVEGTLTVTKEFMLGSLVYDETTIKGDKGDKGDMGDMGDKGDKGDKGDFFKKDDALATELDLFEMRTGNQSKPRRSFYVDVKEYAFPDNHLKPVMTIRGDFIGLIQQGELPNHAVSNYVEYFSSLQKGSAALSKHILLGTPPYARGVDGKPFHMYGLVVQNRWDFMSFHLTPRYSANVADGMYADAIVAWGNELQSRLCLRFIGRKPFGKGQLLDGKNSCAIPDANKAEGPGVDTHGKRVRDVVVVHPNGKVKVRGTVVALGYQEVSDGRLKEGVEPIPGALQRVSALQGVQYQWKKKRTFPYSEQKGRRQMGLVAQDVERIFPEVVSTDEKGFKSIDYGRLTPALIEALKEQQAIIDEQRARLDRLEAAVAALSAATSVPSPKARDPRPRTSKPKKKPRIDRPARGSRQ